MEKGQSMETHPKNDPRAALLAAALVHVPFEGMNRAALLAGARDLDLSPEQADLFFPRGGADLAAAYHRVADAKLLAWLQEGGAEGLRFRDKVAAALFHRLGLVDREIVRAASATMTLPHYGDLSARLVWETADTVWRGLGDGSQDVNWYSKRATLAAVWAAVVLFWLGDDSEGFADTRAFIDRRIDNVMQVEKIKAGLRKLPFAGAVAGALTGWIKAPAAPDLPGGMR